MISVLSDKMNFVTPLGALTLVHCPTGPISSSDSLSTFMAVFLGTLIA